MKEIGTLTEKLLMYTFKNLISRHKQAFRVDSEILTKAVKSYQLICNFDKTNKIKIRGYKVTEHPLKGESLYK